VAATAQRYRPNPSNDVFRVSQKAWDGDLIAHTFPLVPRPPSHTTRRSPAMRLFTTARIASPARFYGIALRVR
jgi:hypothetical protein